MNVHSSEHEVLERGRRKPELHWGIIKQLYGFLPPELQNSPTNSEDSLKGEMCPNSCFSCSLSSCAFIAYMKEMGIKGKYNQGTVTLEAKP